MNKYKVVLSDQVKGALSKLNKRDKNKIFKVISKIAGNPKIGTPWNPKTVSYWPNEKYCKYCGTPVLMLMDPKDNEVHFYCESPTCDPFWMTKKELIKGRTEFLNYIKKTPRGTGFKGLDPKKIKFLED